MDVPHVWALDLTVDGVVEQQRAVSTLDHHVIQQ